MKYLLTMILLASLSFAQNIPDSLKLFPTYNDRASFEKATGLQAPAYNPSKPRKTWFDPNAHCAISGVSTYSVVNDDQVETLTLSNCDASTVNLPGKYVWPKYTSPYTTNVISVVDRVGNVLMSYQPELQVPLSLAKALQARIAKDLGVGISDPKLAISEFDVAKNLAGNTIGASVRYADGPGEPRRMYFIGSAMVGTLLKAEGAYGASHPGKWTYTGSTFNFVPSPEPPDGLAEKTFTYLPIPIKPLGPNEQIYNRAGFITVGPKQSAPTSTDNNIVLGTFTEEDRQTLNKILEKLSVLIP